MKSFIHILNVTLYSVLLIHTVMHMCSWSWCFVAASVAEEVKNSWKELNSLLTDNTMVSPLIYSVPHYHTVHVQTICLVFV